MCDEIAVKASKAMPIRERASAAVCGRMTIEILKTESRLGNHGSWVALEYGAGQVYSQSPRPVRGGVSERKIITSQAKRTVKALELEFPVLKIRAAVQVSLWTLHMMTMPDQSGLLVLHVRWDAIQFKLRVHAFNEHVYTSDLFPLTRI